MGSSKRSRNYCDNITYEVVPKKTLALSKACLTVRGCYVYADAMPTIEVHANLRTTPLLSCKKARVDGRHRLSRKI